MEKLETVSNLHRPHSCFELFSAKGAVMCAAVLESALLLAFLFAFFLLESSHFFRPSDLLRPVIISISTLYALGIFSSLIGVTSNRLLPMSLAAALLQAFMLFADAIALSIVILMAIGNRCQFLYKIHDRIVDEDRFEKLFGPFWMYLSAISLHITVAINMCFLQTLNPFISQLREQCRGASPIQKNYTN